MEKKENKQQSSKKNESKLERLPAGHPIDQMSNMTQTKRETSPEHFHTLEDGVEKMIADPHEMHDHGHMDGNNQHHHESIKTDDSSIVGQQPHEHHDGMLFSHESSHMEEDHHGHHGDHQTPHDHGNHHAHMVKDFKKRFFISLILMIPILILSPMIQTFFNVDWRFFGDSYLLFGLSTVLFLYGGKPFFTGALQEIKQKTPAMMMLISLAICVAYIYSSFTVFGLSGTDFFWELSTLIVIMLLGHWIEMKSAMGASKALEALVNLMPSEAHLYIDKINTLDVLVKTLKVGDVVLVKPGEKVPVDGIVTDGISSVNESMITGESVPTTKTLGMGVVGGSINGDGVLMVKVGKIGADTFLSQVIKLVQEAQESKSKTQRLADIAAKWLFYLAVIAGTSTFVFWMIDGQGLAFSIERAVTVIIIACPHALGLAIPLVTSVSTSIAARKGLLIRNRAAFEEARKIDTVVFDKTGTLTEGQFGITDLVSSNGNPDELLRLAYSMEANSEHPIALGIVKEGKKQNLTLSKVKDYANIPGQGLQGLIDGKTIRIVSPGYLNEHKISFETTEYQKLAAERKTVVFVLADDELIGYIALSDRIKEDAKKAIAILKSMKITTIMLTGDNLAVAQNVGRTLGIDQIIAEVLPQEKSLKILELKKQHLKVAMTGDGINDAPALANADLGIAIGAGTDVAIETADIILVRSNPLDVVNIIQLSKATYRKMVQNLIWATGYNLIALPLAAGILMNQGIVLSPAVGAALMSLSALIVSINAKLLKLK